ncbi:MAG: hypothetical protein ACI4QM_04805, partial [Alphaproteobacteria bacterium]
MKRVLKENILSFYTTYQGNDLLVFRHILNDKDDFESRTRKNRFYDYITTEKALFSTFIISTPTQLYVTHLSFPFGNVAIAPIVVLDEEKAIVTRQFGNLIFTTDTDNFLKIVPMFHKYMSDKAKEIVALPIRNNIYLNDAPDKLEYDFSRASAFDHRMNTFRFNARLNEIEA